MAGAGDIGEGEVLRHETRDHAGGEVGIDEVRQAEDQACHSEAHPRHRQRHVAGEERQVEQAARRDDIGSNQGGADQHGAVLGDRQPTGDGFIAVDQADNDRHDEQDQPGNNQHGCGEAGRAAREQPCPANDQDCSGQITDLRMHRHTVRNRLPLHGQIAVQEAQGPDSNDADRKQPPAKIRQSHVSPLLCFHQRGAL